MQQALFLLFVFLSYSSSANVLKMALSKNKNSEQAVTPSLARLLLVGEYRISTGKSDSISLLDQETAHHSTSKLRNNDQLGC